MMVALLIAVTLLIVVCILQQLEIQDIKNRIS